MLDYYSSEPRQEDFERAVTDDQGNLYSQGFEKLLKGADSPIVRIHPDCAMICNKAFERCETLQSVFIPESVRAIGAYAFSGCIMLNSIIIPESLTDMGIHVFDGCHRLERVVLPHNLSFLPHCTFYDCSSLASVDVPEGVTTIGKGAFIDCVSLRRIHLPDSLTGLWHDVFDGCRSLERILISRETYERLLLDQHDNELTSSYLRQMIDFDIPESSPQATE